MGVELVAASIADRAYEKIRSDIIFGRLAPGLRLLLDRLATSYSASVSTLREILSRLSSEGTRMGRKDRQPATAEAAILIQHANGIAETFRRAGG